MIGHLSKDDSPYDQAWLMAQLMKRSGEWLLVDSPLFFIWLIHFSHMTYPIAFLASLFPSLQTTFYFWLLLTHLSLPGWLIDSSLFPFLYFLFLCFVIQLTQLPTKHIASSCIVVAWGFVYKGLCLTCNNNNKFTQKKSKFQSRLVLESLELSIHQVQKVKSCLLSHSNTWQSHPYITLFFIFVKFTPRHRLNSCCLKPLC